MVADILSAIGWFSVGWSARFLWRRFKERTRHVLPFQVEEDPATLGAMMMGLRMENARLRKESATKDRIIIRLHERLGKEAV